MKPSMNRDLLPPEEPEDPFWELLEETFPHLWEHLEETFPHLVRWCRKYGYAEGEDAVITAQAEEEVARQLKRDGDIAEQYEKHLEIQRKRWMDEQEV